MQIYFKVWRYKMLKYVKTCMLEANFVKSMNFYQNQTKNQTMVC